MAILQSQLNYKQPDELFEFTNGIVFDKRIAAQEVRVQKAWARELVRLEVINQQDFENACAALDEAEALIKADKFEWNIRDEDIHMHLENFVSEKCGIIGKKMHLGRSRNDLIATTMRLYIADSVQETIDNLEKVIPILKQKAIETKHIYVPGSTHLQHGQPVSFAHIMLAYANMFKKDLAGLASAKKYALRSMPLGAAALAGTPLPLNLQVVADELGFKQPNINSYEAVGDRDFLVNALNTFAICATHFSRFSEDCIYWAATPVELLNLSKRWSTGSSIMPNKRNPDVQELTRGKASHIIGAYTDAISLVKTVPTSYGSDLHETKQVFMRGFDELNYIIKAWTGFLEEISINEDRAAELCNKGHILATEVADFLVENGIAFRDAYKIVAELVAKAQEQKIQVHELDLDFVNSTITEKGYSVLTEYNFTVEKAVARRQNSGGTSLEQIEKQIQAL
ncbi:MAG TPA: argininosuccinate lyase [Alphaproteobacteria bacterium]|nr:argininosuccinate lyase [Alphaproteobacteria bacterium]